MSQVTLAIGGKNYAVSCADGEEQHIEKLGAMIASKLDQLGGNLSPSPAQNLLFSALFLADELHEARGGEVKAAPADDGKTNQQLEETRLELYAIKAERDALAKELSRLREPAASAGDEGDVSELLEKLAESLENHAELLEGKAATS